MEGLDNTEHLEGLDNKEHLEEHLEEQLEEQLEDECKHLESQKGLADLTRLEYSLI